VTNDPPLWDPYYPVGGGVTHFMSAGSVVHASFKIAQGKKPKASVIIPPHAYGWTGMESLMAPLVNAGVNVFTFHPRGMWDNESEYTLISAIDDVHSAVEFLRTSEAAGKKTALGHGYRVDPDKIGVLGLSGGGATVGLAAAAENEAINFAVAIAPANHELHRDLSILDAGKETFDFIKAETAGRVDVEKRARGMQPAEVDRLSSVARARELVNKKVLLIGAAKDRATPIESCHLPIVKAFRDVGATHFTDAIIDTDHSFSGAEIALARLVISWLRDESII
jgi:hypothetical protein